MRFPTHHHADNPHDVGNDVLLRRHPQVGDRVSYQFLGNAAAPAGPVRYYRVVAVDRPGYTGGSADGMLLLERPNGSRIAMHRDHVTLLSY